MSDARTYRSMDVYSDGKILAHDGQVFVDGLGSLNVYSTDGVEVLSLSGVTETQRVGSMVAHTGEVGGEQVTLKMLPSGGGCGCGAKG